MRRSIGFFALVTSVTVVACGPAPEPQEEVQGPTRADDVSEVVGLEGLSVSLGVLGEQGASQAETCGQVAAITVDRRGGQAGHLVGRDEQLLDPGAITSNDHTEPSVVGCRVGGSR